MKLLFLFSLSFCFLLFSTINAHAYIDPGTGSLILQGLIAAAAAGITAVKIYWFKIKNFFSKYKNAPPED